MKNGHHPQSIDGFCDRRGICRSTFYNHRDLMPRTIKIGQRVLILEEHEREWVESGGLDRFLTRNAATASEAA